jgi:glycosyltransferase involved in cell wall biosynthesis
VNVLWISAGGGDAVGGAELSLLEGVRALEPYGVHPIVAIRTDGHFGERLRLAGASVVIAPVAPWAVAGSRPLRHLVRPAAAATWHTVRAWRQLIAVVREAAVDVVLTNTLTLPIGAFVARSAHLPHIWYAHELPRTFQFVFGSRGSLSLVNHLSATVLANSNVCRNTLAQHGITSKARVLYYAVETPDNVERVSRRTRTHLQLAHFGVVADHKGQADAVRAVDCLRRKGIAANLKIVGEKSEWYFARLEELITSLTLREHIEFTGFVAHPFPHIVDADIVVMCGRNETFGRITVEAMKLGTPVVGARSGGTAELIRDEWNGLLYEPGDAEGLATQIVRLHENPRLATRIRHNAYIWARDTFNLPKYGAELYDVMENLPSRRRTRAV